MTAAFTADDVLVEAGRELDRRGWTRNTARKETGEVCALGALYGAYFRLSNVDMNHPNQEALQSARRACELVARSLLLDLVRDWHAASVADYNDRWASGPEDIHRLYEKARKLLAEEATHVDV